MTISTSVSRFCQPRKTRLNACLRVELHLSIWLMPCLMERLILLWNNWLVARALLRWRWACWLKRFLRIWHGYLNGLVLRRFNIRGLIVTESHFRIFSRNYGCICCLVSSFSICLRLYLIAWRRLLWHRLKSRIRSIRCVIICVAEATCVRFMWEWHVKRRMLSNLLICLRSPNIWVTAWHLLLKIRWNTNVS